MPHTSPKQYLRYKQGDENVSQEEKLKTPELEKNDSGVFEELDSAAEAVKERKILEKNISPDKKPNKNISQEKILPVQTTTLQKVKTAGKIAGAVTIAGVAAVGFKKIITSASENISYFFKNAWSKIPFIGGEKPQKKPKEDFLSTVGDVVIQIAATFGMVKGLEFLGKKYTVGKFISEKFSGEKEEVKKLEEKEEEKSKNKKKTEQEEDENKKVYNNKKNSQEKYIPGQKKIVFLDNPYTIIDPFFKDILEKYPRKKKISFQKIIKSPAKMKRLQFAQKIFDKSKVLPPFLQNFCPFMPFQESNGYELTAKSNAGAGGPWQFIKKTGNKYGLTGKDFNDIQKSTLAACRYLEDIYTEIGKNKYFKILVKRYPDQKKDLQNFTTVSIYNTGEVNIYEAFKILATEKKFRNTVDTAAQKPYGLFSLIMKATSSQTGWRKYAEKKKNGNYGPQSRGYVPEILGFYELAVKNRLV